MVDLDPELLVIIDETSTKMARLHGRTLKGERLRAGIPQPLEDHDLRCRSAPQRNCWRRWCSTARSTAMPFRPTSTRCWCRTASRRHRDHGHSVQPQGAAIRQAIEAAGAILLFLPPYGPDFNPIENAFAKLKALLRAAAERTIDALWITIGSLIDRFTPHKCANYFTAAGYDAT